MATLESDIYRMTANCDALAWGFASVCVVMGLAIMVLTVLWNGARRREIHDGVYLQISVSDLTETIHLGECVMPMDHLYQENSRQPLISSINVANGWGSHAATIQWTRVLYATQVVEGTQAVEMTLPSRIMITGAMARRLSGTANRGVIVRLLRYIGGLATVIPKGTPMISASGWSGIGVRETESRVVRSTPRIARPVSRRDADPNTAQSQRTIEDRGEALRLEVVPENVTIARGDDVYAELI